jgi:hypothetical protein
MLPPWLREGQQGHNLAFLCLQALLSLHVFEVVDLPRALPDPMRFTNLQKLEVHLAADSQGLAWLAQLAPLNHLLSLLLELEDSPAALELPALSSLTNMSLEFVGPGPATLAVPLGGFSCLRELLVVDVQSSSTVALMAGSEPGVAAQLTKVTVTSPRVSLDLAALPALQDLDLCASGLVAARNAAAATALTALRFGFYSAEEISEPCLELLRAAQASLRALSLWGTWPPQLPAVIGGLGRLEVLDVESEGGAQLPPAGCVVWGSLRALSWAVGDAVPQVSLATASCQLFLKCST